MSASIGLLKLKFPDASKRFVATILHSNDGKAMLVEVKTLYTPPDLPPDPLKNMELPEIVATLNCGSFEMILIVPSDVKLLRSHANHGPGAPGTILVNVPL